ncbi:MAG: dockerin type I domain-containing protein [Candidatus Krumholzibacteriota bacterium]
MRTFVRLSICLMVTALLCPTLAIGGTDSLPGGGGGILPPPDTCRGVTPGDFNNDGQIDISDLVSIINFVCHDGPPPFPLGNGDVNADCEINLDDAYYLVDYMFKGGPAPLDCVCGTPVIGPCEASCDVVLPGDANGDGQLDIGDLTFIINMLCHGGPPPSPLGNGDVNADCIINLDDVYYLVDYMFNGGPAPMDCVCGAPTIGGCEASCDYVVNGDANTDGQVDISDLVYLINMLCKGGPPPSPLGNGDVNADCIIDGDDVYYLVDYMFNGGPAPMDCECGAPTIGECAFDCDGVVPGDLDNSGGIDIVDLTFLIDFLCNGGPEPSTLGNGDVNADCIIDMGDIDYLVDYMFNGGPAPMDCMCGAPAVGQCDQNKSRNLDLEGLLGDKDLPSKYGLSQNHPNPFNPKTEISFSLPTGSAVRLEIFDLAGKKIRTLVDGTYGPGDHTVIWDGTDAAGTTVSAGVYLYSVTADGFVQTRKMMLIK